MASTVSTSTPRLAPWLEERIKQHKEEVARLRAQFGDPEEALNKFILDRFEREALVPDERLLSGTNVKVWEDDDDLDAW